MRKGLLTTLIISLGFTNFTDAQVIPLKWATSQGGTNQVYGKDVASDFDGNTYNIGVFAGTIDLNPGLDVFNVTSPGAFSVFVSKLDENGDFVWGFMLPTQFSQNNEGNAITVDAAGNVYITGGYQNTVDFDPSAGVSNLTAVGSMDIYVAKYDTDGNLIWAKSMGGNSEDIAYGITVDNLGNVYTAGLFYETADFNPGAGVSNLSAVGGVAMDAFVSKLDSNGDFVWVKQLGGTNDDYAADIAMDAVGRILVTGTFFESATFDPNGMAVNLTSNGLNDIWVLTLDADGTLVLADNFGGPENDNGISITSDESDNIFIGGQFRGTVDFDNGVGVASKTSEGLLDGFVLKLTSSGNFVWVKQIGSTGNTAVRGVGVDATGKVYATGYFSTTADFDMDGSGELITSAGGTDIFIAQFATNGDYIWAHGFGSATADTGDGLHVDASGNVYMTGQYRETIDFDPATTVFNLTAVAMTDAFTLKLGCANSGVDVVEACDSYEWIDGITYVNSNNTATWTLQNQAGCDSIVTLNLTIIESPVADSPVDVSECDSYELPALTLGNSYYTATEAGGTMLTAGTEITSSQILFVYTENGLCWSENSFEITITETPVADAPDDVFACEGYILPELSPGNNYYLMPEAEDGLMNAGDILYFPLNITMYVHATNGDCWSENSFQITISQTPALVEFLYTNPCDEPFVLPVISTGNYYTESGGNGTMLFAGDEITTNQVIYVYANNGGCTAEYSFEITIGELPDVTVTQNGIELTANQNGATYKWYSCDDLNAPIGLNQSFTASENGDYLVVVTSGWCSDTSECITVSTVGLSENELSFAVYPNPSQGVFVLKTNSLEASYSVVDVLGKTILEGNTTGVETLLDLSTVQSGVYFLLLHNQTVQLVKQ